MFEKMNKIIHQNMDKYQNKYRIPSARLQNWDYGAVGSYFVTICTQNREHFFGEIVRNEMILSAIGKKVEEEWLKTIALRPDMNLELGNFVVMPNHFHGILIIGENEFNSDLKMGMGMDTGMETGIDTGMETGMDAGIKTVAGTGYGTNKKNKFGPQSKNLGSIIRGFKSAVTTYSKIVNNTDGDAIHGVSTDEKNGGSADEKNGGSANEKNGVSIEFGWQPRFHDHIIRDSAEFERIQNYIANNVANWNIDKFYK